MPKLRDIMTSEVEVVSPNATITEAAEKMRSLDVGALPVCDGDRLRGMITDRDIAVRAIADHMDPDQARVSDVMTRDVVYCYDSDSVKNAAKVMQDKQIRRIIVLDRNKRLRGIVSLGDLAVETSRSRLAGKTLEEVSDSDKFNYALRERNYSSGSGKSIWGAAIGGSAILGALWYIVSQRRGGAEAGSSVSEQRTTAA